MRPENTFFNIQLSNSRIVDPAKERTTVYRYEEDAAPIIIPFESDINVGIYQSLSINIAKLLK